MNDIYDRFGATVTFSEGQQGLFIVVSQEKDPSSNIHAHGGSVVFRLDKGRSVIARLTLTNALALQKEKGILMVSGVQLDVQKYNAVLASLGASLVPPRQ